MTLGLFYRLHMILTAALAAFTEWFCSKGGVYQTTIVTLGVVVAEMTHAIPDPHGFWMLYVLTVYSAVTQPALAYSGAIAARQMEELQRQNTEMIEQNTKLLEHQQKMLDHMASVRDFHQQLTDFHRQVVERGGIHVLPELRPPDPPPALA